MNSFSRYVLILLLLAASIGYSQTKGLIYKPAGNALGKSVLDPNGDGYASLTTAGFSGADYGSASELNMVPLPIIGAEPTGDLTTGGSGGATDIVSVGENSNQSCYVLYKTVGGVPYLIVRFRLGGASTAAKGYSLLIDVDGTFGSQYTDPKNPGYEREIVLNTGSSNFVDVNTFSGLAGDITASVQFSNENYTQRSIALTTIGGNADYFYDFFIPYSALGLTTEPVRIAAATISSAGSGISGTKSDYSGVNDSLYGNNSIAIAKALISTFPATSLTSLTSGASFASPKTSVPVVTGGITTSNTSISGTSTEVDGTTIQVYKNGIALGSVITVTSNAWVLTGVSGLAAGDLITAKATATNKTISDFSASVQVTGVQTCYTPAPLSLVRAGSQIITGTYAHANGSAVVGSTVRIRLYAQANDGTTITYTEISPASSIYVLVDGTWSFPTGLTNPNFNSTTIVATATYASCVSTYSVASKKTNGQVGTITATPTMVTTQIIASPTISRSVQVTNNDTTASNLILYVNGIQVAVSPTTVAPNATYTFGYTGFIEGDIVTVRAQSTTVDYWISDPTANLVVIASATVTSTPVISGTYIAGSGKTVTGTSTESAGTVIFLYKGPTLLGSTTVDAFGNWSISGLTLTANDVLTATAKATGETISSSSTSKTVAASAPTPPAVSGASYQAGANSISGTGGLGTGITLIVYVDGSSIGTIPNAQASWTLSGIASGQLYKGAVITATNTTVSTGVESVLSNSVPVVGVASFCITDTSGNPITAKQSGETFDIKITAMDGSNCTGNVFTGFNGTVVLSSSTSMLLGGGTTAVFVNGVLEHSVALGTSGTAITLSAINSDDPSTAGIATLNVTASVWTGATSTDFNTGSNWSSNLVPVSGADISIPAVANAPVLTTSVIVGNLDIASNATLGLGGQTLTVSGGFAGAGTLIGGGDSSLVVNGAGSSGTLYMDQSTPGTSNILKDCTLNKDVLASSVTIGNELNLTGTLSLTRGMLNTGGYLVLRSSANATAVVGQIVDCSGVAISGEVTVEKFIPARRAFRLLTSPVTTTSFIRDNWQEGANNINTAYSGNQNAKPGYGTHITGVLTNSPGFDLTQTTNNSMFAYNNATAAWVAVANTNATTLLAGVPYRLMVRGDRSIDLNTNTPTPTNTILRSKGMLKICDAPSIILSAASEGTSFVGNPYQAVVDIKAALIAGTNMNTGFYWLWDPMLNSRGGYVTFDLNANSPSVVTSLVNQYLQPGQACFVQNNATGNGVVTFKENQKAITPVNGSISRVAASKNSYIKLNLYESNALANQATAADGLIVKFGSNFTNDIDATDANKFTNLDENFATNNNGKLLSIESRAMPQSTDEIALHINQYRKLNYSIVAEAKNIEGVTPFLFDKFNQTYTEIPLDGAAKYNYSITSSDALSTSSTRFDIVFKTKSTLGTEMNEFKQGIQLYPNPVNESWFLLSSSTGTQDLEIEIFNVLGQKINFSTSNLEANTIKVEISKVTKKGVYWVNVKQNGQEVTHKIIIN